MSEETYEKPYGSERISTNERINLIRDPQSAGIFNPYKPAPTCGTDLSEIEHDTDLLEQIHNQHINEIFNEPYEDFRLLDESLLEKQIKLEKVDIEIYGTKKLHDKSPDNVVSQGWIAFITDCQRFYYNLDFRFVRIDNFKNLGLPLVDFSNGGHTHPYYKIADEVIFDSVFNGHAKSSDYLISILKDKELDYKPFDWGYVIYHRPTKTLTYSFLNENGEVKL